MKMDLTPWRPTGELSRLRREMDDLWSRFFGAPAETVSTAWMPSIDLSETDGDIQVKAELPGLESDDIDVNISGDLLTIRGEKKEEREAEEKSYHARERYYGAFQRTVRLPSEVKAEDAEARFKNGVLNLKLPKAETARSRKIEIKS